MKFLWSCAYSRGNLCFIGHVFWAYTGPWKAWTVDSGSWNSQCRAWGYYSSEATRAKRRVQLKRAYSFQSLGVVGLCLLAVDRVDGIETAHQDQQHADIGEVAQTLLRESQYDLQSKSQFKLTLHTIFPLWKASWLWTYQRSDVSNLIELPNCCMYLTVNNSWKISIHEGIARKVSIFEEHLWH